MASLLDDGRITITIIDSRRKEKVSIIQMMPREKKRTK